MAFDLLVAGKSILSFGAKKIYSEYKNRKRLAIIEKISQKKLSITAEIAASDEFISAYLALENALFKSTSKDKLELLTDLFIFGCNTGKILSEPDRFSEILSIIDELSDRELIILYHLYCYSDEFLQPGQTKPEYNHQIQYLQESTPLSREHIIAILVRLRRTGLLITIGEREEQFDLMMTGIETMCISPIADEIKTWIYDSIHGVVAVK